jgi:phosphoenolpyruvate carboxylase
MHRQWPFFRTLLSNMDMVLAKSDLAWPRATASWCRTPAAQAGVRRHRGRVAAHQRGARAITGDAAPGANPRWRARSPPLPYIDPLHHLQVELMRRWRAGQHDDRVQTGIHICINGIAAGLRNTG